METNIEPKQTIDESVDAFLNRGTGAPAESSPANTPTVATEEGGSDPLKTPSTPSPAGKAPETELGPVPYDKFQEQVKRRQEIEKVLESERREREGLSSLLDDPDTLKRYLKRQGYTDFEVRQKLQERGMPYEDGQKEAVMDRVLKRMYGDKLDNLKPEDKQGIRETMAIVEAVTREIIGEEVRPFKGFVDQRERESKVDAELSEAESMSKEDGIDFDKEALPAMQIILDELYKVNPNFRKNPPSATLLYEKAAKRIMRDRLQTGNRQEVRDAKKLNAKPLTPSAPIQPPKDRKPLKTEAELSAEIDRKLDELGYRG
jgi:hypothetical protein